MAHRIKEGIGQATIVQSDLLSIAALTSFCKVFVSNDSGIMHLAAAAGTTTVGLFGPTDEKLTGPRGEASLAIRAPGTSPVYDTDNNYKFEQSPHKTLRQLSADQVFEALKPYF
jgi:ADP-heptose:LPS heptosyltransferase